jgi:Domain of unknown function (DUF4832)
MPYAGNHAFPHSLEWFYIPLSALQTDYDSFSWAELDQQLDAISARGHQAAFRVYLDYPGKASGMPNFLSQVARRSYSEDGGGSSPDYSNPDLQRALLSFIGALGARYDGDPRVGFITAGLIGFWGEWHTYPHNDWMASTTFLNQVLDTYERAFPRTMILAREPKTGVNMDRARLGFHDDSFAFSTLGTTSWHFKPLLQEAGLNDAWRTRTIGGELRPEVQPCVWNKPSCVPSGQDFSLSVSATHASWILNDYIFTNSINSEQWVRAISGARSLGYTLHVPTATVGARQGGPLRGNVTVENRGVAPFYYPWTVRVGVLDGQGKLHMWPMNWDLRKVLPDAPQTWNFDIAGHGLPAGSYTLLVGVLNPLAGGRPLRFANNSQDENIDGWLSLGQFNVRAEQ